jgi:Leucine-rich repeat (LRR) protein
MRNFRTIFSFYQSIFHRSFSVFLALMVLSSSLFLSATVPDESMSNNSPNGWYSQRDENWAGDRLGSESQTASDCTIGEYGCAMTCGAMLNQMEISGDSAEVTPKSFNQWLIDNEGYAYNEYPPNGFYAEIKWNKIADMDGTGGLIYNGYDDNENNWAYLDSQLNSGNMVIVKVVNQDFPNGHWVLVVERNGVSEQPSSYKIYDPWPIGYTERTLQYYYNSSYGKTFLKSRAYSGIWRTGFNVHNNIQVIRYWGRTMCYDNDLYLGSTGPWTTPYDWDPEYREGNFRSTYRIINTGAEPVFIDHLVLAVYKSNGDFVRYMNEIGSSSPKYVYNLNIEVGDEYKFDEAWTSFNQDETKEYRIVAEAFIGGEKYQLQTKDYLSLDKDQVGVTLTVTDFSMVLKTLLSSNQNAEGLWAVKATNASGETGRFEAAYELHNITSDPVHIAELSLAVIKEAIHKNMKIPGTDEYTITDIDIAPGGSLRFPPPQTQGTNSSSTNQHGKSLDKINDTSDMAYYDFSQSETGDYKVIPKIIFNGQTYNMGYQDLKVIGFENITSIKITGWSIVSENSGTQYTCTAYHTDGSTTNVTGAADWTLEGAINSSINNSGYLTTYEITSDDDCRIRASYGGMYDLFNVTIENIGSNLQAPYNLTASKGNYSDHIAISWSIGPGTDQVSIQRKKDDGSWLSLGWTDSLTSHTDNDVDLYSVYYYKVRAHNTSTGDVSPESNEDSGFLKEPTADEKTPQNVTATNDSANLIQLTCDWMDGVNGWKVYRSESVNGAYSLIKDYDNNQGFVYNDYSAEPGIYYYYKLTSYGSFGESPPSSPVGGSKLLYIGGMSPASGSPGDTITIIHSQSPPDYPFGLGANQGTVYFGSTPAAVISWSNEQITATAPEGSGTVEVTVTSPASIASINSIPFTFNSTSTVTLQPGPGEGKDIWTTSRYSYAPGGGGPGGGLDNHELRVGGSGDQYYSLIEFDLTTLPAAPAISAKLYLYSMANLGTPTEMYLDRITEFWDWDRNDRLWWADRPATEQWGNILPAAERNVWYSIDITDLFNAWQDGTYPNYGIQLRPVNNSDNWNYFYSSDYLDDPSMRPKLVIEFAGKDLSYVGMTGPLEVEENSGAQYNCTAYYSDGTSADVTAAVTWSVDSSYAAVNNSGYLTTSSVPSDQTCRISFTYTEGGITKSGYQDITIFKPKITVITPNGGESFKVDSTLTITWETAGTVDQVKIEYSTDNGSSWVTEIDSVINENSYPWNIPGNPSQNCLVKISNAFGGVPSDESDAVFSIVPDSTGPFQRVSINSDGVTQGDGPSQYPSISGDGRYITFASKAGTLVDEGGNGSYQVFVHDRDTGQTELVSRALDGGLGNGTSNNPSISSDGRYVSFQSNSSNLVTGYGPYQGNYHIYLYDRQLSQTTLVTVSLSGGYPGFPSSFPMISPDGNYIVFDSESDELVPGDTNPQGDVFCYDRTTGQIQQISSPQNAGTWQIAMFGAISSGGRYVVFMSSIKYVPTVTNDRMHIYLYDRQTSQFELISASSDGTQADQSSYTPSISADGNYVAFDSSASALVPEGGNGNDQVFLRDRNNNQIELISKATDGSLGNGNSSDAVISADGRYVTFKSLATNLAAGDTNGKEDIFVYDRQTLEITRISVFPDGIQPNGDSRSPTISGDGSIVGFDSDAGNMVSGDTNGVWDVFVKPRSTPVTYTLTVQSTPETGIPITVTPIDKDGNGDGNTIFSRTYNPDTIVTLTAPSSHNSKDFVKWTIDGQDDINPTIQVTMNANHTVEAYYDEHTSIILSSPNGGENWEVGSIQEITWTTTGTVGNVKIDYSIDNGVNWSNVITSTENDGLYSWTVPNIPSSQCIVRVSEIDSALSDESDSTFTISCITNITVTHPNGGETFEIGSTLNITWITDCFDGNVLIEYSIDNGAAWIILVGSTENDGTFTWTVPDIPSIQCLIRVCDVGRNYCDTSDAVFSFVEAPDITVTSPNGDENWEAGSSFNITWTADGLTGNVTIDLYKNGIFNKNIGTADVHSSTFPWTISTEQEEGSDYTVKIYQGTVEDFSDNPFTISSQQIEEPEIKITHGTTEIPDGGSFNYADTAIGNKVDETFTIENTGNADLILSNLPITITGNNADQFSVIQQPTTPINPGGTSTFIIRFAPSSEGAKTAAISIANNDLDENPYDITLNGTGTENIIPTIERSALIALYESTNGNEWTYKSGWKDQPLHTDGFAMPGTEGTWYGITVENMDGEEHVTRIELNFNNLSGDIPTALGNLSNLKVFDLGVNISFNPNPIPGWITTTNLPQLEIIRLDGINLTGSIPIALGQFGNLISINLSNNSLEENIPTELGSLLKLEELLLYNNQLTGDIPDELANLTKLKNLDLESNQLSDSFPDWVTNLTDLWNLNLGGCGLTGTIPQEIGNLTNLITLVLSNNQLTGTVPTKICQLTQLNYLNLSNNNLWGDILTTIVCLHKLQVLYLFSNEFTGSIPVEFENLSSLTHLYLGDNHFSGPLPSELGNLLNLKNFFLQSNMFIGEIPTSIMNLTDLEYLDIGYNGLYTSDEALRDFLDEKDPDWETTQTVAPSDITVTPVDCNSIQLNWTPIIYIQDEGSYKVSLRKESEEDYTYYDKTVDKTVSSMTVTGLTQSTNYYFIIKTCTEPHSQNKNTVCSEYSDEASGVTPLCPPSITVNTPNGGEIWEAGATQSITWSAVNIEGNVIIEYSTGGGDSYSVIESPPVDDGSYNWTVPDTPSDNCLVRISSGTSDDSPSDTSDEVFSIISPASADITITSPNGGENWEVGSIREITWTSYGFSGEIKIEYSIDNRYSWTTIVTSTDNDGSYNWIVPNNPSGNCFIRISRSDSDEDISDVSNAAFSIVPASSPIVTVILPNGGERLTVGTLYTITWASSENFNDVKIEFSADNGITWTDLIVSTPNDGSFEWIVPDSPSESCLIRVSDTNGETSDVSDAVFSIVPPSNETVTITFPNGGESWEVGSSQNITWTSTGTIEDVIIEYSTDNGSSWIGVVSATPNDGSFEWTVPDTPSDECLVRISGSDGDEAPSDVSDSVFSIASASSLLLTAPNGEEIIHPEENFLIKWISNYQRIANIKLEYSPDNGTTYLPIGDRIPNTGCYQWQVPHHISSNCLVRISNAEAMKPSQPSLLYDIKFKISVFAEPFLNSEMFTIWLGDLLNVNEDMRHLVPKISLGRESNGNIYLQFDESTAKIPEIASLSNKWHRLKILLNPDTKLESLWLDNTLVFENLPMKPCSIFIPAVSFSISANAPESFTGVEIDDFNVCIFDSIGRENRCIKLFVEDFETFEEGKLPGRNSGWRWTDSNQPKADRSKNSGNIFVTLDSITRVKSLCLQTIGEIEPLAVKYFNIPQNFPFDTSDKPFEIKGLARLY